VSGNERERWLLEAIIEASADAVFVKDLHGRYIVCNESAAQALGVSPAAVLGRSDADLLPAKKAKALASIDRRVIATGTAELAEDPRGNGRRYLTRMSPVRDPAGHIIAVVGVSRDVTERLQAQEALAEREALLRLVIDALPVGILVVNRDGDVMLSNPAMSSIWGETIRRGVVRWDRSRGWWHGTREPVHAHEWASVRALHEGTPQLDQLVDIEGFDGVFRTIRNSAVPIRTSQGVDGAVVLVEDITERVRLQQALAQASQLEALGRLAGGVAHDFNNLLMVITSFAEIVITSLSTQDPRRNDLAEIKRAVDSASHLTRQLLAFGRRQISQPRTVAAEDVVTGVRTMLSRVLGPGITIEVALAETHHTVYVDPVQLEQVLVNLALNARDAMPGGGVLTLSTRSRGDHVVIGVRDTGTGMDPATRARIFEPFFTTKERGRGNGLGLASAHGIVEQFGGRIEVTSEVGHGTLFEIELPVRAQSAAPAPHSETSSRPTSAGGTVLLVEDSAPVRLAVRAMLTALGYIVHDVAHADAAIAYLASRTQVDGMLTDVMLDGRSGRHLAEEARALRPELRVLFMSGYPDDAALDGDPAAVATLAKPFTVDALERALGTVLSSFTSRT